MSAPSPAPSSATSSARAAARWPPRWPAPWSAASSATRSAASSMSATASWRARPSTTPGSAARPPAGALAQSRQRPLRRDRRRGLLQARRLPLPQLRAHGSGSTAARRPCAAPPAATPTAPGRRSAERKGALAEGVMRRCDRPAIAQYAPDQVGAIAPYQPTAFAASSGQTPAPAPSSNPSLGPGVRSPAATDRQRMLLWIAFALLTAAVLAWVLAPLARPRPPAARRRPRRARSRSIATSSPRSRPSAPRGLLGAAEAEAAQGSRSPAGCSPAPRRRREPPRRARAAAPTGTTSASRSPPPLAVPLLTLALYLAHGSPGMPSGSLSRAHGRCRASRPSSPRMIAKVEARLREASRRRQGLGGDRARLSQARPLRRRRQRLRQRRPPPGRDACSCSPASPRPPSSPRTASSPRRPASPTRRSSSSSPAASSRASGWPWPRSRTAGSPTRWPTTRRCWRRRRPMRPIAPPLEKRIAEVSRRMSPGAGQPEPSAAGPDRGRYGGRRQARPPSSARR